MKLLGECHCFEEEEEVVSAICLECFYRTYESFFQDEGGQICRQCGCSQVFPISLILSIVPPEGLGTILEVGQLC